jgi:uncharacterized phiE125 gp8 family phage protein
VGLAAEVGTAWTLVTGPTVWPITLAEAKQQARITDDHSNELLTSYIRTATEAAQEYLGRGLTTQIWQLALDGWANVIPLPMAAPMQVVTIATVAYPKVEYYDTAGTIQTLATTAYDTDLISRPARIVLKSGQSWPSLASERRNGRVVISYVVGWAAVSDIPELIKQGIRMYVTYLDLDRDGMETLAANARAAAERCWGDRVYWTPPEWG